MSGTVQSSIQVRAYVRVLLLSTQARLQYRFRFYVPLVSGTIWVVVQMSLWVALYRRSGLSSANMGGLRLNDVLTYVTLSYFIGQLYPSHLVGRMSQDVRDGRLNPYLLKPISYIGCLLADYVGDRAVSVLLMAPLVVTIALTGRKWWSVGGPGDVTIGIGLLILSLLLSFLWNACIGLSAFWLEESFALSFWNNFISQVFSGRTFPLTVFPHTLQTLIGFSPFPWMNYFCVLVLIGRETAPEIWSGLLETCAWIVLLLAAVTLLWRAGIRRYSGIGG